ncbi:MAG: VOC family protein [Kineothrix sp.]|nr:VOC family protein [Kineothrix sp.]
MNGIRHTGIYVKDLKAMVFFYKEVFGLKTAVHQRENGIYTDTIFHEENVDIEVYKLEFANKTMLELIHYQGFTDSPDREEKIYRCGKMHIAITVDSAWEMYGKLRERNCNILSEPCDSPDGKARVFFARDIEGNYLELVEEL